jgi:hypothetical protein
MAQVGELIETLLKRRQGALGAVVSVYFQGRLLGLLRAENIGGFATHRRTRDLRQSLPRAEPGELRPDMGYSPHIQTRGIGR